MKQIGLALMMVAVFATTALADGFYVSGGGGVNFVQDSTVRSYATPWNSVDVDFDPGFRFDVAAGYRWRALRFEGEAIYQQGDGNSFKGDVTALGGMANIWGDIKTESICSPYVGAGIGFMNVEFNNEGWTSPIIGSVDDTQFAWQIGAGLGFGVTKELSIDVGYRFLATSDLEFRGAEAEYKTHNVRVGVRYEF